MSAECPFCQRVAEGAYLRGLGEAFAFADAFPVSSGHHLIVSRAHIPNFFDLDPDIQADMWALAADLQRELAATHGADGFNIGLNAGPAAGQTVGHVHIHVIPRYSGDVPDPRGGVRWVLPERANYWDKS